MTTIPQLRNFQAWRERASGAGSGSILPLIEGYGDESKNDYQSWQIFSNDCAPCNSRSPQSSGLEARVAWRKQKKFYNLGPLVII